MGKRFTFHAELALESRSSSMGKCSPSSAAVSFAVRALPSISTASTTNGLRASATRSRSMLGNSALHGSHQVAQKLSSTTLPR